MKRLVIVLVALVVLFGGIKQISAAPITCKELMNLTTMEEASTSILSILDLVEPLDVVQILNLSGNTSESEWDMSISGTLNNKAIDIALNGNLSGDFGQNIVVSFGGSGYWGQDQIQITQGLTTWFFDAQEQDYIDFDFQELTQIGVGSVFGWSVGLEWFGGATLGAIGGAICGAPLGPVVATGTGIIGAIGGGEAAASLSKRVHKLVAGGSPPPHSLSFVRPHFLAMI